jgi:hypothetical protein
MKRPARTIMLADDISPAAHSRPQSSAVPTVPREDVGAGFEARRLVRDLDASIANGDAFQTTPLERRHLVVTDKTHEGADQTDAGGV